MFDPAFLQSFDTIVDWLAALGLAAARVFGLMSVFPAFTIPQFGPAVRGGIAIAIALPVVPLAVDMVEPLRAAGGVMYAVHAGKEILVGMIVGAILAIPIWGVAAAAEFVDFYRGATAAQIADPATGAQTGVFANLSDMAHVTFFLLMGGGLILAGALYDSYGIWPLGVLLPDFSAGAPAFLMGFLDALFRIALVYAAPFLIAMFLAELTLTLVNQFARQIQVFELSLTLKNLIFLVGLMIMAYFFVPFHAHDLPTRETVGARLEALFP
ncbi:MAG: type III secretion system export apparatus subunit SctT [Alphaproteobacteria bacterium]|nr:type III secretion system export apparatus subunit SctT [Alphaproteobacteria bacterium]MDX5368324.1 type III secretion system export apparatus subunit SctT [Alphaproteobacteria bacterium]MDX5463119.1 type III secretion system export apparatus subunit SctT [Alphaproteobacteria bacterium]